MARSRAFTFTLFNPDVSLEDHRDEFMTHAKYVVFQKEVAPTTGREHYQGYLFLEGHNGIVRASVPKRFPCLRGSHIEIAQGSVADNKKYCTKEESRVAGPWEFGSEPSVGRPKAKHSIEDAIAALEEAHYDLDVLARSQPILFAKFHRQLEALAARCQPKPVIDFSQPRDWQQSVVDLVKSDPDSRSVNWYVDPLGGQGKTFLSKYLISEFDAFYCTGGRHQDILHAYNNQNVIIFDFTRDKADMVCYNVIEMLKNGVFFSGKYQSTTKARVGEAHVIVFSNFEPDMTKLSQDRWRITHLSGPMAPRPDPVAQVFLGV